MIAILALAIIFEFRIEFHAEHMKTLRQRQRPFNLGTGF